MNYQKITTYDICNGKDLGVVLWVSGCELHCKGCHNPETWGFSSGKNFGVCAHQQLFEELKKPYIKRFTLSGGHPLAAENITECTTLCKDIKKHFPNIKIWVYTGFTFEHIKAVEIMEYIDILVDGSYKEELRDITLPFRGSSNQRIINVQESLKQNRTVLYEI